jgi:GYF domain 2/PilZ domain
MSVFYVAQNGLQLGPFSVSQIEEKIKSGKLSWEDFVYDDKSQDWLLLMEFAPLTKFFNQSFKANPILDKFEKVSVDSDELKRRSWYVLKQKNNYGPFSKYEIIQMLQGRTVTEYDYIWNKNLKAWKKLSEVPDFSAEAIRKIFTELNANKNLEENADKIFYRRKFSRKKLKSVAVVHDHKKIYNSVGYEIGGGGIGLTIEGAEFEIGQQIYIHLKPEGDVPSFNAICKIVSRRGDQYGLQFEKISASVKKSLLEMTSEDPFNKAS